MVWQTKKAMVACNWSVSHPQMFVCCFSRFQHWLVEFYALERIRGQIGIDGDSEVGEVGMKIIRFKITTVIPLEDNRTQDDIEDDLIEALENVGSRFTSWTAETEEVED